MVSPPSGCSVQLERRGRVDGPGLQQCSRAGAAVRRRLQVNGARAAARRAAVETAEQRLARPVVSASASRAHLRLHRPCPSTWPHCARGRGARQTHCFYRPDKLSRSERSFTGGIIGPYRARRAHKRGEWVEIGQVEAFLAVGTFGGFRRAADALRVTQPAISARIRALEQSLGVPLFVRSQIGLARSLHHPEVETLSLRDDPLVLVTRPESKVARARRVRLDDVAAQPLIFFDRGSSDWTLTHGLFRRAGLVPNVVLEVETIETAKRMVERGMGLAFLPHLAVVNEIRRRRLLALEISDAEPLSRSLDVIHPRQRPLSQEALGLLKTLRAAVGEEAGSPRRQARKTNASPVNGSRPSG